MCVDAIASVRLNYLHHVHSYRIVGVYFGSFRLEAEVTIPSRHMQCRQTISIFHEYQLSRTEAVRIP